MHFDYLNVLVFAGVGFIFVFANMIVGSIIRPKRGHTEGLEIYECGEETIGDAWIQFDIRYYTVALVYIVFAVEIAFLFPVMKIIRSTLGDAGAAAGTGIGAIALLHVAVFVVVLFMGLVSVWAKGDLDWVLTYDQSKYAPRDPKPIRLPNVTEIEAEREAEKHGDGTDDSDQESAA